MVCKTVLICQNRTCRRQGAAKVLAAFQAARSEAVVQATGCLGQCGSGPMVLVLPDQIWYGSVRPEEVAVVVDRHLQQGQPVQAMLHHRRN